MWTNHLRAILWKSYLLREKSKIQTILQVTLPILLFILLEFGRSSISGLSKKKVNYVTYSKKMALDFTMKNDDTLIYYCPTNEYFDDLIQRVLDKFQMTHDSAKGFENEEKILNESKKKKFVIAIIFHSFAGSSNLDYTLRQEYLINESEEYWGTDALYHNKFQFLPGKGSRYLSQDLLAIQKALDLSFIAKEKEKKDPLDLASVNQIEIQEFPFPPHRENPGSDLLFKLYLPLIIFSMFSAFISLTNLKSIMVEKQTGIKELMKLVGISNWIIWLGWFIYATVPATLSMIIITILLKVNLFLSDYPFIEYTNGTIIFVFLLIYLYCITIACFLISTWTDKPIIARVLGEFFLIIGFFLVDIVVILKIKLPFSTHIIFMLLPNTWLIYGFATMMEYEIREEELEWSNLHYIPEGQYELDVIPMSYIFLMIFVDCIIYFLLALYLDAINPGRYGIPRPPNFPFKILYNMIKKRKNDNIEDASELNQTEDVEKANLPKGIELINLGKNYGKKPVVKNLSMDIYKNQITVLLGHNGAGKTTTMAMIAGMTNKTTGKILINGKEVFSRSDITQSLGFCTQDSLVFSTLTVSEQLKFFAMLKGKTCEEANEEIEVLLQKFHMSDKRDSLAHVLSGGMKRKLCLGIAIIGGSKILILDEPSSGLDPQSRRELWDLLQKFRIERTLLISTHFMEEADALGDWIAILNEGELKCFGTPMYLKKKYETGSNLILLIKKDKNVKQAVQKLENLIRTQFNFRTAKCKSINGNEVQFFLPDGNYIKLFEFLESNKAQSDIETISFTSTTLEDVFLSPKVTLHDEADEEVQSDLLSIARRKEPVFCLTLKALLYKRCRFFLRTLMFYAIFFSIGILIIALFFYLSQLTKSAKKEKTAKGPPLKMTLNTYGETTVYMKASGNEVNQIYKRLVLDQNSELESVSNIIQSIVQESKENLTNYERNLIVAADFSSNTDDGIKAVALYNNFPLHSAPISLNLITNTIAQYELGDQYSILTKYHPLTIGANIVEKSSIEDDMFVITLWVFGCMPLGFILIVGCFIYFPNIELSTKFTQLQFMCGVQPGVYWTLNLIFDLIMYSILAVIISFILNLMYMPYQGINEFSALLLILLLYGLCAIPFSYLWSRIQSFATSYTYFLSLYGMTPMILVSMTYGFKYLIDKKIVNEIGDVLHVLFLITLPQYSLVWFGVVFTKKANENYNFDHADEADRFRECFLVGKNPCCEGKSSACDKYRSYMEQLNPDIWYMLLCAVIYFMLTIMLDSYWEKLAMNWARSKCYRKKYKSYVDMDTAEELSDHSTLRVKKIKKYYSGKLIVNNMSLSVTKGECMGILGVNGAGKTTTFKMLTRDEVKDDGSIKINGYSVENIEYLKKLGYCPQHDALNYILSGREILTTMAMLRGIKDDQIVDQFLDIYDVKKIANIRFEHYSGGNKRRISFAVAVIGFPDFILLDEPTTGVDPLSKRKFWSLIKKIKEMNENSFILTSHSMAECEAVCNDLKIMKSGTIKLEGPITKLKNEVSGINVMIKLKQDKGGRTTQGQIKTVNELKNYLNRRFPTGKIRDEHSGMINYFIETKEKKWSQLFIFFDDLKQKCDLIEDYSINEASLEDVFLNVARDDNDDENLQGRQNGEELIRNSSSGSRSDL